MSSSTEATEPTAGSSSQGPPSAQNTSGSKGNENAKKKFSGRRFFSAYAQTWIGMSPIWLMGEALMPGAKVGGTFKGGLKKLGGVTEELCDALQLNSKDVLVILDKHFKIGKENASKVGVNDADMKKYQDESRKAAEVIRAAGEDAIIAVTTSLANAQSQIQDSSPQMKKFVKKHGKDIIVLVDKSLKNPIVVTGISRFAKSRGIPYSEALLRLASMGLSRILAALPDEVEEEVERKIVEEAARKRREAAGRGQVEELDAEELERSSSSEAQQEAKEAAKLSKDPKVEQRKDGCIIC